MVRDSSNSLAPGFRFHPTDEEIVRYYLQRKVSGKSFRFDPISVVDIYKSEPWDLPGKSKLKTRDLEWYFFSPLDRKYENSSRTNRATEKGYWKTTGKDRPVHHNSRTVGMKKTLVYHSGRAPRGARSNWVMHEYKLTDEDLEKAGFVQDNFVLCRIFQKSGTGPKNGEQYGAPFIEEEWENDEGEELTETLVAGGEIVGNERLADDDMPFSVDDIAQYLDEGFTGEDAQFPLNFCPENTGHNVELPHLLVENYQVPGMSMGNPVEVQDNQDFFQLPEQGGQDGKSGKDGCFADSRDMFNNMDVNYLLDEPYPSVSDNHALNEELFLETDDLSNPVETAPADLDALEEYLTFFDADEDLQLSFDPAEIFGSEVPISSQTVFEKQTNWAPENEFVAIKQMFVDSSSDASTSKRKPAAEASETDSKSPLLKRANYMLGNIPAPPALASEFPSKDMVMRLNSAAQTSSSVHVTAGMIQFRNVTLSGDGDVVNPLYGKNVDVNLILSFDRQQGDANSISPLPTYGAQKNGVMGSRGFLFFFILFWVLILSVSFKVGSCIYAH